jgi:DNA invertase Pin-like site-specific DNA recombinase
MRATTWSTWTHPAEVALRAGGRRQYNAHRRLLAALRRRELVRMIVESDALPFGSGAEYARRLGVSRSTVCRDLARLLRLEATGW